MMDESDEFLKHRIKKWAGAYDPHRINRERILDLAYAEHVLKVRGNHQDRRDWKQVFFLDWFFHSGNEWNIDHHSSIRFTSFYIASNGHLVL